MKQILLMIGVVALVGCGKKEPVQPTAPNTEAAKPEPTNAKAAVGGKLWEFETVGFVDSSLAIGFDGTIYVGSEVPGNKLYAIKTESKGLAKNSWPLRGQNPLHTGRAFGEVILYGVGVAHILWPCKHAFFPGSHRLFLWPLHLLQNRPSLPVALST